MQNTESFGRGNIGQTITSGQTTPFTLKVSYVPFNENQYITINPDTTKEEIFFYTTKTGTSGGAGTINVTSRGYNKYNTSTDVGNQQEHDINSIFKITDNHIILGGKVDRVDLASISNGEGAYLVGIEDVGNYFTSTNLEGALQELAAGAPGVADASETVAGKVEIATDVELGILTTNGSTGAKLGLTTSNATITQVPNKIPVTDTNGRVVKYINTQSDGKATTSEKGLVELATSSEATAGLDEELVMSPKTTKDSIKDSISTSLNPRSFGVVYGPTTEAGFVQASRISVNGDVGVQGLIGNTPTPNIYVGYSIGYSPKSGSICFPVPKGWYYKVDSFGGYASTDSMNFIPLR